jgi:hypothetical protein
MSASARPTPGDAMPQIDGMLPNTGKLPREAAGKRVIVELCNGRICGQDAAPLLGWAADGQSGCRWTLTGNGWDIAFYRVVS